MSNLKNHLLELFMYLLTRVHWRRLFSGRSGISTPNFDRVPWTLTATVSLVSRLRIGDKT